MINAGQAAEAALLRHLRRLRPPPREITPGKRTPTLGRLMELEIENASDQGREAVLPDHFESGVLNVRNRVMHRGESVDDWQAAATFEITKSLVATVLPRSYLHEPYGLVARRDPAAAP